MWLIPILQNHWKLFFVGILIASLAAYGQLMKHQRDYAQEKLATLQERVAMAKAISDQYRETAEKNLEILQKSIPIMVDQAGSTAVQNWRKRNPAPAACGLQNLPGSSTPTDPARGAESAHATLPNGVVDPAEQLAKDCGRTTELFNQWRRWAEMNRLPIKE